MTSAGRVAILLVAFAIAGCSTTEPPLNSERIEKRFGSFGIDIIASDDRKRIANLYSMEGDRRVCRTWAMVRFADSIDPAVTSEHALVLTGQPMGAVFKARGWRISKRNLEIGSRPLARSDAGIAELMGIDTTATVAYHTYVFSVSRAGISVDYAVITEIHHPDYLSWSDLQTIYGAVTETVAGLRLTLGSREHRVIGYQGTRT